MKLQQKVVEMEWLNNEVEVELFEKAKGLWQDNKESTSSNVYVYMIR